MILKLLLSGRELSFFSFVLIVLLFSKDLSADVFGSQIEQSFFFAMSKSEAEFSPWEKSGMDNFFSLDIGLCLLWKKDSIYTVRMPEKRE